MTEILKVSYKIDLRQFSKSRLIEFLNFLNEIRKFEQDFIDWAYRSEQYFGTNATDLKKIENNIIRLSFPVFYDDYENDQNCIFMTKENFVQFLTDWQAFGKSGKKYMMLREEDGWISLEDMKG